MTPELPSITTVLNARSAPVICAVVTPDAHRCEMIGAPHDADLEIGSVSKAYTGLLYKDAVERGVVDSQAPVGQYLPLGDAPVAHVTLESLATHHSGLPRSPRGLQPWRASYRLLRHGTNPYGHTLDQTLEQARATPLKGPRFRYSNIGFQLLGHAVAAASGASYVEALQSRLLGPLGLEHTYMPATPTHLRPEAIIGTGRWGGAREAWVGEGVGPAGGIRTTADDALAMVRALLSGTAPGISALDPVAKAGGMGAVGAGWLTSPWGPGKAPVTWHNGGTGGFRSFVGLSRETGHGVFVVLAQARSVDRPGLRLLHQVMTSTT